MKIIEKYTGEKTYMFPNGVLATPKVMLEQFPAILTFVHIIETDENGEVAFSVQNLSAMRGFYKIDSSLNESEAIQAIQDAINTEPIDDGTISNEELTATSLASIAASLEYQNMMTLDDADVSSDTASDTVTV